MTAGAPAFALEGAGRRFGERVALAGVDLHVRRGERVAVIGPSGAGKSTLIALLNGTLAPSTGAVRVLGAPLAGRSERERRRLLAEVGTIHQGLELVGPLRVVHNVSAGRLGRWGLGRAALSLLWPRGAGEVDRALARVGLADRRDDRTDRLSGGERQRVALARLLVQRPAGILADEPVASLDRVRAATAMDLLVELATELEAALVVSLHDVELARARFERIVGLRDGTVAFDAAPAAVSEAMLDALYAGEPAPA